MLLRTPNLFHNGEMPDSQATTPLRPVALVTGVGRRAGIGFAVAQQLALDGYDVAVSHWGPYDERVHGQATDRVNFEVGSLEVHGGRAVQIEADLQKSNSIGELFTKVESSLGSVSALVMCHCESIDSGILDTTEESFDRHFAVNARSTWLLIREFARRYRSNSGEGRIVAFTSDHTTANLPYGASKGALDRIVIAASQEFAGLGISANVINPGPTDTGWIGTELASQIVSATPLGRLGAPTDAARLVSFLCSPEGGWINGQLIHSNGEFAPSS